MHEIRGARFAIRILLYKSMPVNWDIDQKLLLRHSRRFNRRVVINYSRAFVEVRIVTFVRTSKLSRGAYRLLAVPVVRNLRHSIQMQFLRALTTCVFLSTIGTFFNEAPGARNYVSFYLSRVPARPINFMAWTNESN